MNPVGCLEWDAKVAAYPGCSIFYRQAWASVLRETYGFTPVYLALPAATPGSPLNLLPLMEVDSWFAGRRGVSLPFTDECPPLAADETSGRQLIEAAIELGTARGWKSVEFRGGREVMGDATAAQLFYGHWLALDCDEDKMFGRMDSATRRAIRKAEKSGLAVTLSRGLEAVKSFYRLHCLTRKKHGLPPQPFAFFRNIHKHLLSQDLGTVVTVRYHHIPIASSIYLQSGSHAIYKFGASDDRYQSLRGTNLVMWEAIKWLARNGATSLHLGRTSKANEGLRRFKLQWGATETSIEYAKYDLRRSRFVVTPDCVTGWHNRVFRALPLFASRLAGNLLYKHWA